MTGRGWALVAVSVVLAACGGSEKTRQAKQAASVEPQFLAGNPTCPEGWYELKVDPPEDGTYTEGAFSVTVDFVDDGRYVNFTDATPDVGYVIVKGGPNAYLYEYDPPVDSDTNLRSPDNEGGQIPAISHVTFCWPEEPPPPPPGELTITKTAETYARGHWSWEIDKGSACPWVSPLPYGASFDIGYWVTLTPTFHAETEWFTSGTITIANETESDAIIDNVDDELDVPDDGTLNLVCPAIDAFPYTLAAGATIECEYSATTETQPSTNTATVDVTAESEVAGGSVTVDVTVVPNEAAEDDCVTVTDTLGGDLGEVCATDEDLTLEYTYTVAGDVCGKWDLENTATFTTNDTQTTGSDSFTVHVRVVGEECPSECPDKCEEEPEYPTAALSIGACGIH